MIGVHEQKNGTVKDVIIREWTLEDLPAVQHVLLTTWLDAYASFIPEEDLRAYFEEHYNLPALQALYHSRGVGGYVAEVGGSLAAYVKTQFSVEEKRFYVSSLYVLPEYQGLGLGTRLMRSAEQCALTYNVDEIWLGVMTQNLPALKWYRSMGFRFVEEQPFTMGKTTVAHLIGFRKVPRDTEITA